MTIQRESYRFESFNKQLESAVRGELKMVSEDIMKRALAEIEEECKKRVVQICARAQVEGFLEPVLNPGGERRYNIVISFLTEAPR